MIDSFQEPGGSSLELDWCSKTRFQKLDVLASSCLCFIDHSECKVQSAMRGTANMETVN